MIEEIIKLRGIGMLHDAVPDGGLTLSKAVAVYAENGRGKSTFAHLLRSLSDNDSTAVSARRALRQDDEPYAELLIDGEKHTLSHGSWNQPHEGLHVFDDRFVEEHVSVGSLIGVKHLERLLAYALRDESAQTSDDVAAVLDECRDGVNARLREFLAEFELATLERKDAGDGARAHFALRLMGSEVPLVAADAASPSFSTALSPAARSLLALALFFWALDDDHELSGKTVVLDDPARGLDRRRKTRLAEAVAGFVGRAQLIVLSHDAEFLKMLREQGFDQVLELRRSGVYCVLQDCDLEAILTEDYSDRPPTPGEAMALL